MGLSLGNLALGAMLSSSRVCMVRASAAESPPARLRLALVRHGESLNNVHETVSVEAYQTGRVADPALSHRGQRQAELLATHLGGEGGAALSLQPIDELWVSPHRRTLQTAAPLAAALGLAPLVATRYFESGGVFEAKDSTYTSYYSHGGLTRLQMRDEFPTYSLPDDVTETGWCSRPAGADGRETKAECRVRAAAVAAELWAEAAALQRSTNRVVVAHHDFVCALLDALTKREHGASFSNWRHHNTGITVLDISAAGHVSIRTANTVTHLAMEPSLVSGVKT